MGLGLGLGLGLGFRLLAYGRIRQGKQDTALSGRYGRIGKDTAGYGRIRQNTAGYGRIRQDTAGYARIRQDTAGYAYYRNTVVLRKPHFKIVWVFWALILDPEPVSLMLFN